MGKWFLLRKDFLEMKIESTKLNKWVNVPYFSQTLITLIYTDFYKNSDFRLQLSAMCVLS